MSRVWDHDHWIPHKIVTCLHEKHFPVTQSGQKLSKTVPKNEKKYVRHMLDSATLSHTETHSATLWVLTYSSMSLGVLTLVFQQKIAFCSHRGQTKHVTCPGPLPFNSWQNSDHFTCK